jgi:hypothetical protein
MIIKQTPDVIHLSSNQSWYAITPTSTFSGKTGYYVEYDFTSVGNTSFFKNRVNVRAGSYGGNAVYDSHNILQYKISVDEPLSAGTYGRCSNSIYNYNLYFREATGSTILSASTLLNRWCIAGADENFDYLDYTCTGVTRKYLSNWIGSRSVRDTDNAFLYYLHYGSSKNTNIFVDTSAGESYYIPIGATFKVVTAANLKQVLNVGPKKIFNSSTILYKYPSNVAVSGSTLTGLTYYDISLGTGGSTDWNFSDNEYCLLPAPLLGKLMFWGTTPHSFKVGDYVNIQQDSGYTNASYNGLKRVYYLPPPSAGRYYIVVDYPFGSNSPANPGIAYSTMQESEVVRYNIDDECIRYNAKEIFWLNNLGGWDNYTFYGLSDDMLKTDNVEMIKLNYEWNGSSVVRNNNGRKIVKKETTQSFTIQSNWLSDDMSLNISAIIESPEIRIYEDGVYKPLVLNTNKTSIKNNIDALVQYEFEFEYCAKKQTLKNI